MIDIFVNGNTSIIKSDRDLSHILNKYKYEGSFNTTLPLKGGLLYEVIGNYKYRILSGLLPSILTQVDSYQVSSPRIPSPSFSPNSALRPYQVEVVKQALHSKRLLIKRKYLNEENYKTVYEDLFSILISGDHKITNIQRDTRLLIEEYVELKKEYSYHALFNKVNWQYFGAARDYKKQQEGDTGPNTVSMGAYSLVDVDPVVHEYADKIYNFLKAYLQEDEYYKGFIFLGIGVDKNNVPMILEINTRSGDPELPVMLDTIDNNLTHLFYAASADIKIPEIKHNKKESVVVRIVNRIYDWTVPASFLPKFENIPNGSKITVDYDSEIHFTVEQPDMTMFQSPNVVDENGYIILE